MEKMGLVFTGGGGKGAYQIGVWKAFREFGIDKHVKAVSGTSVGALNLALFLQGNLQKAEDIWLNLSPGKILTFPQEKFLERIKKMIPQKISLKLDTKSFNNGYFTREGLKKLMREDINLRYVSKSRIPFYATCLNTATLTPVYFKLNGRTTRYIESVLLASSAIPGIFDSVEIDGERYWDGGSFLFLKGDNAPVLPLYEEGCDVIVVVHLDTKHLVDHSLYPNAQIVEIVPHSNQGGFINGTLDFTSSGSAKRIKQGYEDTKRVLQPIVQMIAVQNKMQKTFETLKAYEQRFQDLRRSFLQKGKEVKVEYDSNQKKSE